MQTLKNIKTGETVRVEKLGGNGALWVLFPGRR